MAYSFTIPETAKEPYRWLRAAWERLTLPASIYQITNPTDLLIFDSNFPNMHAGFRIAELNAYLVRYPHAKVVSENVQFLSFLKVYLQYYPQNSNRIFKFNRFFQYQAKLAYILFLNESFYFLPYLEKNKIPFIFVLFPGGGFRLNNRASDHKLKRLFASPYFRKVLVTQNPTYQYLTKKQLCPLDKMEFQYGGVIPYQAYSQNYKPHLQYKKDKPTFDLCFVAFKYSKIGLEKGYDVFIAVAHQLCHKYPDINFHVVGNFTPSDIDVTALGNRIRFYGTHPTEFFPQFYQSMDIFISANRVNDGQFDGLPTAACLEAALSGVVIFFPDLLDIIRNPLTGESYYEDTIHFRAIKYEVEAITQLVLEYYHDPKRLKPLAKRMKKRVLQLFDNKKQLGLRYGLIDEEIGKSALSTQR